MKAASCLHCHALIYALNSASEWGWYEKRPLTSFALAGDGDRTDWSLHHFALVRPEQWVWPNSKWNDSVTWRASPFLNRLSGSLNLGTENIASINTTASLGHKLANTSTLPGCFCLRLSFSSALSELSSLVWIPMGLEEELEYSDELPSRGSGWAGWSTSTRSSVDKASVSNQGMQTKMVRPAWHDPVTTVPQHQLTCTGAQDLQRQALAMKHKSGGVSSRWLVANHSHGSHRETNNFLALHIHRNCIFWLCPVKPMAFWKTKLTTGWWRSRKRMSLLLYKDIWSPVSTALCSAPFLPAAWLPRILWIGPTCVVGGTLATPLLVTEGGVVGFRHRFSDFSL